MSKRMLSIILGTLVFLGVTLVPAANAEPKLTLRLSHPNPETHVFHKVAMRFQQEVAERSNGEVAINIFPSNQLGKTKEVVQHTSLGVIDLLIHSASGLTGYNPELDVLDLPFLFPDRETAYAKLDGEVGQYLAKPLERKNFKLLGYVDGGFRSMFNTKKPLVHPSDFKGLHVRVQDSPVYMNLMSTLGALPAFLPWPDLYVSISQGVVDAGEGGLAQIWSMRFFEVAPYVSLTNHTFTSVMFVMAKNRFDKLPPEQQQWIQEAAKAAIQYGRDVILADEQAALENITKAGAKVNTVDPEEFREAVAPVWEAYKRQKGDKLIKLLTE